MSLSRSLAGWSRRWPCAVVLAAIAGGAGCSSSSWSPTREAMTRAEANSLLQQQSVARHQGHTGRSLVLADDHYSRISEPAVFSNASNRTATAAVPTGE